MLEQLHSEVDRLEEKRDEATRLAERAKDIVIKALEQGATPIEAMELAAQIIGMEADALTNDAFKLGVQFSLERAGAK